MYNTYCEVGGNFPRKRETGREGEGREREKYDLKKG